MTGVSVVICCYNSRDRIEETLHHLANQRRVPGADYEFVLVDNNSTDDTVEAAKKYWSSMRQPFPMRVVAENKPGLSFARITGVRAATHEHIVFCDDDNRLDEDYLATAHRHFEEMNDVAVIGGVGIADFEGEPPEWFARVNGFGYAVGDEQRHTGYVESVYGAGMAVRKSVFLEVIDEENLSLADRTGYELSSGGDTEVCLQIAKAGYRIYLDRDMTFEHYLPQSRLTWEYYLRLRRSFGIARARLQPPERQRNRSITDIASLGWFYVRNWRYALFSSHIKTAASADFVQESAMRMTALR